MKRINLVLIATVALGAGAAFAYDPQGSGKISDGNCNCKNTCDQHAKAGALPGPKLAQCKSDRQQRFAGCNKGAQR